MNVQRILHWLLVLISIATLISGVVQVFAPGFILGLIGGENVPATREGFGTIGMFMALFGGMMLQVLLSGEIVQPVFLWSGLQKIGAFIAVAIGVERHLFSPMAMAVASFDLLSGILIFVYMRNVAQQRSDR